MPQTLLWELGLPLAAFVLALPIGWERAEAHRPAGMRTFPLVALSTCGFVLLGIRVFEADPQAQARVIQGVMTGIGFIGGGAILKRKNEVVGVATATGIWTTGAIGSAVAYRYFGIAILLSLATFLTLRVLTPFLDTASRSAPGDDDGEDDDGS